MTIEATLQTPAPSTGSRLVATDGRDLPLGSVALEVAASGGIARTTLRQTFRNPHRETLQVQYTLPLPADGAVGGFAFTIAGQRVEGRIEERAQAREDFEDAVAAGRTAALVEQERSSVFTQEVGNLPAGAELLVEITVDQKLRWVEGGWEYRFPTVVAPRYQGAPGRVADAGRVDVDVAPAGQEPAIPCTLALVVGEDLESGTGPASPSHAALLTRTDASVRVALAEHAVLDRDVVVRWQVPRPRTGATLRTAASAHEGRPCLHGLATLVPPAVATAPVARDIVVLLDTSGSMSGLPLEQAKAVLVPLVEALGEGDRLELHSFSDVVESWRPGHVPATPQAKREALAWLRSRKAAGSTEMAAAMRRALEPLREGAQRQVVLVTDGQVGFEAEVLCQVLQHLPVGCRVHAVGVGDATNRSLTAPVARAGRGTEVVVGLDEKPALAGARLVRATRAPTVSALRITGSALQAHAPAHLADLLPDQPVLVPLLLAPEGGTLHLEGTTSEGAWKVDLAVPPAGPQAGDPALARLYGRELVEDLEAEACASGDPATVEPRILEAGLRYRIATRLTSWVATGDTGVDPGEGFRRVRVPQQLPHGMNAMGAGLHGVTQCYALSAAPVCGAVPAVAWVGGAPTLRSAMKGVGVVRACSTSLGGGHGGGGMYGAGGGWSASPGGGHGGSDDVFSGFFDARPDCTPEAFPGFRETATDTVPVIRTGGAAGAGATGPVTAEALAAWLSSACGQPETVLQGQVRRSRADGDGQEFIIEITLPVPLDWSPAEDLVVETGGAWKLAKICMKRTTKAAVLAAGCCLRVVLRVPEACPGLQSLRITCRNRVLVVRL
jgi:Ca-activated chloride channel family protein